MNRKFLLTLFSFVLLLWFVQPSAVLASCVPSQSGTVFTLGSNCSFSGTVDGVDAGEGTTNTAKLQVSGSTLTIGNNQSISVGSFEAVNGGKIIIPEGGLIYINKPLWMTDADGDGYPAITTKILSATQPANGLRVSALAYPTVQDSNDSEKCAAADTPSTVGSALYNTTCQTCTDGALVNQTNSEDLYNQCADAVNCNGSGACACSADGAVCTENSDCCTGSCTSFYTDSDGDTYGVGSAVKKCGTSLPSYATNNTDCNDTGTNAANVWVSATCYVDADNDNYGSVTAKSCTNHATCGSATWASGAAGTAAASGNFAVNNTDCDDADAAVYAITQTTGGTITTSGNYRIHTFTSAGTFAPKCVSSVIVKMWGGGGGGGYNIFGYAAYSGGGGYTTGTVAVTSGESLTVVVGGGGKAGTTSCANASGGTGGGGVGICLRSDGVNPGGGGGRSALLRSTSSLLVAGGGGGGGGYGYTVGGAGGGASGADANGPCGYRGYGGSQSAGGASGGSLSQGGSGLEWGGGGGGGYYGGGGGYWVSSSCIGGGGGGSGYIGGTGVSSASTTAGSGTTQANSGDSDCGGAGAGGTNGVNGTNGKVIIKYIYQ